ncbi:hypothetical protein VaNZ11_009347 [Volvox africanus]|uniref:Uncharacterized protein n=1 Tax=Volvox africanus TaxID=51714 RepID=A0ABQ5S758_9CHLO|nr:hypothetical protein VaNZ11_009347 [Volvox africanus]
MAPLGVRYKLPIGNKKLQQLAYKAKLPWFQRRVTSAWRLQSRLEVEVGTLKTVIEALQASSEEALAAADQRTEVLQLQMAALQQQTQLAEANVRVLKAEHEQQVSMLTSHLRSAEQVAQQERSQWRVKEEVIRTDAQARVCTAEAKAACAHSKLKTEILTTEKFRQEVQAAMEAATMDAAKSAQLAMDLQAAKSEIEVLHKESREWKAREEDMCSKLRAFARRNEQEGQEFRVELENKDFELDFLRAKMARQEKIVQDTALRVQAMEKDNCAMKENLTEEIGRLKHLVTCTEKRAADATADYDGAMRMVARLKLQLSEVWAGKASAWSIRAEATAENVELRAQLVEAKVTIARERSLARVDRREEIRCLKLELRNVNESWSRRCEELKDSLWRREAQAAGRTGTAACSRPTSGR